MKRKQMHGEPCADVPTSSSSSSSPLQTAVLPFRNVYTTYSSYASFWGKLDSDQIQTDSMDLFRQASRQFQQIFELLFQSLPTVLMRTESRQWKAFLQSSVDLRNPHVHSAFNHCSISVSMDVPLTGPPEWIVYLSWAHFNSSIRVICSFHLLERKITSQRWLAQSGATSLTEVDRLFSRDHLGQYYPDLQGCDVYEWIQALWSVTFLPLGFQAFP